jgi:hypothetical protein
MALVWATMFGLYLVLAADHMVVWIAWACVAGLMLVCVGSWTVLRLRYERKRVDPSNPRSYVAILRDVLRGRADDAS